MSTGSDSQIQTSLYDKRNDFINYLFLSNNKDYLPTKFEAYNTALNSNLT